MFYAAKKQEERMDRKLMLKRIVKLLKYVQDLEGLLWCVQQYAAEGMNRER